jgi:hypothetical protein
MKTRRIRNKQALAKVSPRVPDPDAVRADLERRRSGAAGKHDSRPRRQRSRRDAKRAAVREW